MKKAIVKIIFLCSLTIGNYVWGGNTIKIFNKNSYNPIVRVVNINFTFKKDNNNKEWQIHKERFLSAMYRMKDITGAHHAPGHSIEIRGLASEHLDVRQYILRIFDILINDDTVINFFEKYVNIDHAYIDRIIVNKTFEMINMDPQYSIDSKYPCLDVMSMELLNLCVSGYIRSSKLSPQNIEHKVLESLDRKISNYLFRENILIQGGKEYDLFIGDANNRHSLKIVTR